MNKLMKLVVLKLVMIAWPDPLTFGANLKDAQFMAEAREGFTQMYNLDYDEAMGTFALLHSQYPQHPAPPLYMATTVWLRELLRRDDLDLNKFATASYFDEPLQRETPVEIRQRFKNFIDESLVLSTSALKKNPADNDAQYLLASAYGVQAAFAISVEHSKVQAFEYGKKSYQLHSQLVSKNPEYYDSYMTLGMYEYITGKLPWYIKWLARMAGYHGSVERGMQYLQLTADRGLYASDDARVMLMVLRVRDGNYGQALDTEEYLQTKYNKSFLLPLTRAQILEKMGEKAEAAGIYQDVIASSDAGVRNYDQLKSGRARYALGRKLMDLDRYDLALPQLRASLRDPAMTANQLASAWLAAGESLDALGRRADAIADYRLVLSLQDFDGTHRLAKNFIDQPYRPVRR